MPKQRIKQRHQQCSRNRNQRGMKTKTPTGIRERGNPSPGPQEPEPLDGIDRQKKQCEEKNARKNQGELSVKKLLWLDALHVWKARPNAAGEMCRKKS